MPGRPRENYTGNEHERAILMPRIFDNIEASLQPALQDSLDELAGCLVPLADELINHNRPRRG